MRSFLIAFAGLTLFATGAAQAKIAITVDKNAQMMTVAVDGVERYQWPVSTGIPSYETPNGSFRTFRMEQDHFSKEFDDAPMPNSIFFTKIGHAIHGTDFEGRLGTPASHGCVRLSKANAATLRHPRTRPNTAVARRDPAPEYAPQYNAAAGDPVVLAPQLPAPREIAPLAQPRGVAPLPQPQVQQPQVQQSDDGYIYPADGSSDVARYPAPRSSRRLYDAQANPQQQYYNNRGYAPQYGQQVYAPRPYQPRGLFTYQD